MHALLAASVVAGALLLSCGLPSRATAVTVGVDSSGTMSVDASVGEPNAVTVARAPAAYTVADSGSGVTMTAGPGCTSTGPSSATCAVGAIVRLSVGLGDMDDAITVAAGLSTTVRGGTGNDIVRGGWGDDALYGDEVSDVVAGSGGDHVEGGAGNDSLTGGRGADALLGDAGDDALKGGSDADTVSGGDGADSLSGEDGADRMDGGPGDDGLDPGPGGVGDGDALLGGDGRDGVSYALRSAPVITTKDGVANDGQGEGDNIGSDVERISGGLAPDRIGGGPDADVLDGGPGPDVVQGLGGDDDLHGDGGLAAGDDDLVGGPGDDRMLGEAGADRLVGEAGDDAMDGGNGDDLLEGGFGSDGLTGGAGNDVAAYAAEVDLHVNLEQGMGRSAEPASSDRIVEVEDVRGGGRGDTLTGTDGRNALAGARGEDYVRGEGGVDRLDGGNSADVVAARDGARDARVSCGPGTDLAIVDARDRVPRRGRNRCERVDDGTRTRPRAGWVYVQPDRCRGAPDGVQVGLAFMRRLVPLRDALLLAAGYRRRAAPTLDAPGCEVRITAARGAGRTASADLSGGAATVRQTFGARLTTTLAVRRPSCGAGRGRARRPPEEVLRVKTDRGRGRWRVRGRYSTAAAIGTDWTTFERCRRTVTVVRRGRVQVYDRVRRRTVVVRAGRRYVARARGLLVELGST